MRTKAALATQPFKGYVQFEDPSWPNAFRISEHCAMTVNLFRERAAGLQLGFQEEEYTRRVVRLHDSAFVIFESLLCTDPFNAALVVAMIHLFRNTAENLVLINSTVQDIQERIAQKANDLFLDISGIRKGEIDEAELLL